MIIRTKDFKNKVALSHSRIKKLQHCYQTYYCTYILKLPDLGNPGSLRGSTIHDTLELLSKDRRKKLVAELRADNTCRNHAGLWKFIVKTAKKYRVDDAANLDIIDKFIVVALNSEFYGPEESIHTFIEKEFDLEVEGDGINFRAKGFIDRFHIAKIDKDLCIFGADYKSSSKKMDKSEVASGQALMYQLALHLLYPNIKMRDFRFIFLKFPNNPYQVYEPVSEEALIGYMYFLTEMQQKINNFSEKDIPLNYGKLNYKMSGLCGPAKSGWICPHQNPLDYYVLLNDKGEILKSSFKEDLMAKEGERVEARHYEGCGFFFKNGKRIRS